MQKRRKKPTRRFRDFQIAQAASRLIEQGYHPSRNDVMRDTECAASIIREALRRLGVTMKEKQIRDIVLKYPPINPA
jgi:hypothetical protein